MPFIAYKSLKSLLEHQCILEVMAGMGRNVEVIKDLNPKSITLVDINPLSIKFAKRKYANDSSIIAECGDLNEWIKKAHHRYRAMIGVWTLSYMDGKQADIFLRWCKKHIYYLILVEPVDRVEQSKQKERFLDQTQQMIVRHKTDYNSLFRKL